MQTTPTGFESLDLIAPLLESLQRAGYKQPSPIQAQLIPVAKTGVDAIGQAQTGTGKTAAFLLPFMNSWRGGDPSKAQGLVLVPTRELAVQVAEEAEKLSPSRHFKTVAVYGGQGFGGQLERLRQGVTLIVGTPGRVMDHLTRGTINLDKVRYVVLDEADRMLDIGFRPQIERIMKRVPTNRQTLLMSATLPDSVMKIKDRYMKEPAHINVVPEVMTVDRIEQRYMTVDEDRKTDLLLRVLEREQPRQCIIFVERKRGADNLFKKLKNHHKRAAAIHGDLPQKQRERIMAAFREGKITVLIATDVMSRGIDVSGISHIVNYDLPNDLENYVHRIGRTGRMGKDGKAISFVCPDQGSVLTEIEHMINLLIEKDSIEGFEAFAPKVKQQPTEAPPKAAPSVYGRTTRKYSRRV